MNCELGWKRLRPGPGRELSPAAAARSLAVVTHSPERTKLALASPCVCFLSQHTPQILS